MLMKMKFCNYLSREHIFIAETTKMKLTTKKLKELILEYMSYDSIKDEDMIVAEPYFGTDNASIADAKEYADDIVKAFEKRYGRFPSKKEFHKYGQIQGPVDEILLGMYDKIVQARGQK